MRDQQIGSAVCRNGHQRIGIGFAQVRHEQFSKQVTWAPTRMRHATNDFGGPFSVRSREIRAHRIKSYARSFNLLAVKRRRCDDRSVTALLQLKRKRHKWMKVAERSPGGKNYSLLCTGL